MLFYFVYSLSLKMSLNFSHIHDQGYMSEKMSSYIFAYVYEEKNG